MRPKQLFPILLIIITQTVTPHTNASGITLTLYITPEPAFNQPMVGETYMFNLTYSNDGVIVSSGEPINSEGSLKYTGNMVVVLKINWNWYGSYDFGEATIGFTKKLDELTLNTTIPIPINGASGWVSFNYTFIRDSFDFGLMPYEDLGLVLTKQLFYEVYDYSNPEEYFKGPKIASSVTNLNLLDDTKIEYVEGKYLEMKGEIEPLKTIEYPQYLNLKRYIGYLETMNSSINQGDYFTALDEFKNYDEKYRATLIFWLTKEAGNALNESHRLTPEIEELESQLQLLQTEFNGLEEKYTSLSVTYWAKQAELEAAKQSLSTAITVVFLASIVSFFFGRRSLARKTMSDS